MWEEKTLQQFPVIKPDKVYAGLDVLDVLIKNRNEKMWTSPENDKLLDQWFEFWPWVRSIADLSLLQATNVINYMYQHNAEQILNHIMDLIPRSMKPQFNP